jgi:DnaJ-class molecular chaperone
MPRDHYRTLQVRRDAEPEVVEKAYRALSLKYHPDTVPPAERRAATLRMQAINEAYRVLRDPASRARYDRALPPEGEGAGAWERFMKVGLAGLFVDWLQRQE